MACRKVWAPGDTATGRPRHRPMDKAGRGCEKPGAFSAEIYPVQHGKCAKDKGGSAFILPARADAAPDSSEAPAMPQTDLGTSERLLTELRGWVERETPSNDPAAVNALL